MPYIWHEVDFANGQARQPWFANHINAFQTIPAIAMTSENVKPGDDRETTEGLVLGESHAILRYICRTADAQEASQCWYPGDRDAQRTARIDQWMAWHHNNLRRHDMFHHIMNLHLTLPMLKYEIQDTLLKPLQESLKHGLALLESHFEKQGALPQSQRTLCGDEHPTLADLTMACELYQIVAIGYRFDAYPWVSQWIDTLSSRQHFKDVSVEILAQGQTIRDQSGSYLDLENAFA